MANKLTLVDLVARALDKPRNGSFATAISNVKFSYDPIVALKALDPSIIRLARGVTNVDLANAISTEARRLLDRRRISAADFRTFATVSGYLIGKPHMTPQITVYDLEDFESPSDMALCELVPVLASEALMDNLNFSGGYVDKKLFGVTSTTDAKALVGYLVSKCVFYDRKAALGLCLSLLDKSLDIYLPYLYNYYYVNCPEYYRELLSIANPIDVYTIRAGVVQYPYTFTSVFTPYTLEKLGLPTDLVLPAKYRALLQFVADHATSANKEACDRVARAIIEAAKARTND